MDDKDQSGRLPQVRVDAPNSDHPDHRKVSIGDTAPEHQYLTIRGGDLDVTLFVRDGDAIGVLVLAYEKSQ